MYTLLYGICLLISAAVLIYMAQKSYEHIDIYQWTIMLIIPVIVMAYWLKSRVNYPEAAGVLVCFTYFDSSILIVALIFANLHTLGINVKPWVKILGYGIACIHLAIVGICFNNHLYYGTLRVEPIKGMGNATRISAGPLMAIHYGYIAAVFLVVIGIVVLAIVRRGSYSKRSFYTYMFMPVGAFLVYVIEAFTSADFSLLPFFYTAADIVFAAVYDNNHIHDITYIMAEQHDTHESRGYVAVGPDHSFLCCNEESYYYLPFLRDQRVNERLSSGAEAGRVINELISDFEREGRTTAKFRTGSMTCVCDVSYFTIRGSGRRQGYLLDIHDGTEEQRNLDLIESYNERLNEEVREKTDSIRGMQRKLVLGMANMIENRDTNTGGHVKRTSDIIHIIVDEIIRQHKFDISEQLAEDIVRAAPTHDLGKVAIDNSILNKPGKFTDEEYEIMKTHSTKSGEMVMILLDGVEEDRFVKVAYNVARYHHERWDGRGYPEGLVGTMIPLEARIMAIADVYDALVSKRVYKDPMSFEKSASIMCECMGTQFDPNLKSVFLGCREKLEQYYMSTAEQ